MNITRKFLTASLAGLVSSGVAWAQDDRQDRSGTQQRQRQAQSAQDERQQDQQREYDSDRSRQQREQGDQSERQRDEQARRDRGQSQGERSQSPESQYRVSPSGWIRVAADYNNDGRFDAIETLYVYDLERARANSRQRKEDEQRKSAGERDRAAQQSDNWRSDRGYSNTRDSGSSRDRDTHTAGRERSEWMDSSDAQDRRGESSSRFSSSESRERSSGQSREGQSSRPQSGNRMESISGEILQLSQEEFAGVDGQVTIAKLRNEQNMPARVVLGPKQKLQRLDLAEGDQVTVEGRHGRVNDRPVLIASRVSSGDQQINVSMKSSRGTKRVRGEVVSTRTANFRNRDEQYTVATIKFQDGEQKEVNLGPKSSVSKLNLSEGDEIKMLVRPARLNGKSSMVADQIWANDKMVDIAKDKEGRGRTKSDRSGSQISQDGSSSDNNVDSAKQASKRQSQDAQSRRNAERGSRDSESDSGAGDAALGIAVSETDLGVLVLAIHPRSPAADSDLQQGDEILAVDGKSVDTAQDVVNAISSRNPEDKIKLKTRRDDETKTLSLELVSRNQLTTNR